jgi:hypothetical protein
MVSTIIPALERTRIGRFSRVVMSCVSQLLNRRAQRSLMMRDYTRLRRMLRLPKGLRSQAVPALERAMESARFRVVEQVTDFRDGQRELAEIPLCRLLPRLLDKILIRESFPIQATLQRPCGGYEFPGNRVYSRVPPGYPLRQNAPHFCGYAVFGWDARNDLVSLLLQQIAENRISPEQWLPPCVAAYGQTVP